MSSVRQDGCEVAPISALCPIEKKDEDTISGNGPSHDGMFVTVVELAAYLGLTPKSVRRFLSTTRIAPVGLLWTGRHPRHLYDLAVVQHARAQRTMMAARATRSQSPTVLTMRRLALAMRD